MATKHYGVRGSGTARPWWRPVAYSAAAAAAIAALFNPVPALASAHAALPSAPQAPAVPAVPDAGSRPTPVGSLVLPGQSVVSTTPAANPGLVATTTDPILQKVEKGRAEIATLGDQLIQLGQDRDLAVTQSTTAQQVYAQAEQALRQAQTDVAAAASAAVREAAAMPPGALAPGLAGLGDLARLQRGDGGSAEAAARQLEAAQSAAQLALDAQTLAATKAAELTSQYDKLNTAVTQKQAAQQTLETTNAAAISAADASETATDTRLGQAYLDGPEAGRGADPRAVQALQYALSQRGKPYVWSTEGPDTYDCSGLMFWSYAKVGVRLNRVSRDQYRQTSDRAVDRYSLLPGDLLFFSYSNSWRGIHHVAMYAGNGMMVEAPRTGLNVRLVPVRWSRLFQATRVLGSVDGDTPLPDLGTPDPDTDDTVPGSTSPTGSPSATTPTSKPPTSPTVKPTTPTTKPTKPSPTPSPSPSTTPTKPTTPTSPTSPTPTTTKPSPTSDPTTPTTPSEATTSPTGGSTSTSAAESPAGGDPGSTSASATKTTSGSASSAESASVSTSGAGSSAGSN
jgi:peptidoglycan DL-endopeptidase CwlO